MAEAIGQVVALAKYPNVSVKMSNLPELSLEPYPYHDLTPHLNACSMPTDRSAAIGAPT